MKTMSCRDFEGACDLKFSAKTFEEITEMLDSHLKKMYKLNDKPHVEAIYKMKALEPRAVEKWLKQKEDEFNALPKDE